MNESEVEARIKAVRFLMVEVNDCFHQWDAVLDVLHKEGHKHLAIVENKPILGIALGAMGEKWMLGLTRLYDESNDVDGLLCLYKDCQEYKGIFSISAIKKRNIRRHGNNNRDYIDAITKNQNDTTDIQFQLIIDVLQETKELVASTVKPLADISAVHSDRRLSEKFVMELKAGINTEAMDEILKNSFKAELGLNRTFREGQRLSLHNTRFSQSGSTIRLGAYESIKRFLDKLSTPDELTSKSN